MTIRRHIRFLPTLLCIAACALLAACSRDTPTELRVPAVELFYPAQGAELTWGEDADPAMPGFQIDIRGALTGFDGLDGASLSLAIDGVSSPALVTLAGATFTFERITLAGGARKLAIAARTARESASIEINVAVPSGAPGEIPAVEISAPNNGKIFAWGEDADSAMPGFQIDVTGLLRGMPAGAALPTVSILIDGILAEVAVQVTPLEAAGESAFSARGLTVAAGIHTLFVEAVQGDARAFAQAHVAIPAAPGSEDPLYALAIEAPANGAALDWSDDVLADAEGFQLNVRGTLRGFGPGAELALARNGIALDAAPIRDAESYEFTDVTLPAGQQVLIVTASETVEGTLIRREALAVISVPSSASPEGLIVDITSPLNGKSFAWSEDSDPAAENFQIDVRGELQAREGEQEVELLLQIDGEDVAAEAIFPRRSAASEGPGAGAPELLPAQEFAFEKVTVASGVHQIAVIAVQGSRRALDQVVIAIPMPLSGAPAAEIVAPLDGAALSLAGERATIDVRGTYANARSLELYVDGRPTASIEPTASQFGEFTFEGVELDMGTHALQVQVSDGTYQGVSPVVTVHVADFGLAIHWPTAAATLYAGVAGDVEVELIGEVQGCGDCRGTPSVAVQIDAGLAEGVPVDAERAFRRTLRFAAPEEGKVALLVRARQALEDTEATGAPPTFEAEERIEIAVLDAAQRPAGAIAITQPADGSRLTWRDNTALSQEKFEISVEASIAGLSLGEASFQLYVDGVLSKTDVSQDCALTTEGQRITALTCRHVSLAEGQHLISLTATQKSNGARLETYSLVTVPAASGAPQAAALSISAPADGAAMDWTGDVSFASGFQADVSGRFTGLGNGVQLSLRIDGTLSNATASIANGTYTFRGVTLASGAHTLEVLAREEAGDELRTASDEISVTVPPAQEITVEAQRIAESSMSRVTGTLQNFSAAAAFSLDIYVDGRRSKSLAPEASEISQGAFSIEVADSEIPALGDMSMACRHLTFTMNGVEGQNLTSASANLEIGRCTEHKPKALIITSPRNGSALQVAGAGSLELAVTGMLIGYAADGAAPEIALSGAASCSADLAAQTFRCAGDFAVGDHALVVRDEVHGIDSEPVNISVRNSSGCPVTLSLENAPIGEDGVLEFNRQTPGIRLANVQGRTTATYTFFGSVPAECAGGTVTVLKKKSGGSYDVEARTTNILADGTFAYRAALSDAETDAELAFSASREYFALAAGAQLTYTADFTVPQLVPGAGDTLAIGAAVATAILHESDLREGLKVPVTSAEADGARGALDFTFTAQGLSSDAAQPDRLTIAYSGSAIPLLDEDIHQAARGTAESFTRQLSLPEGDWMLSVTLADAVGNTSAESFPIHVDLGCGVRLTSPLPNSAIAIDPGMVAALPSLALSGTSTCARVAYELRIGEGARTSEACQPSGEDGAFTCRAELAPSAGATEIALIAPNGAEQSVRAFQLSSDHDITVEAPHLKDGGFVVVSAQNRHCGTAAGSDVGACSDGYAIDLAPEDAQHGSFALKLAIAMDAQYGELSCRYLLGGQPLGVDCPITRDGRIDDVLSLPQGTRGDLQVEITGTHTESGATLSASLAMGVTIASTRLSAPTFRLPADGAVADCAAGGEVTCVRDRHQGILDVWLDAPAPGLTRARGFATGTAISIASSANNTEAFDAATFEDGKLMTWFSALAQENSPLEMQRLQVTPMNLIHLGAQDEDVHGNYSDVAMVKSIDMFWNVFRRTFAEENAASELRIDGASGMLFGQLAAVGDFNGDGLDDLAVTLGSHANKGMMIIYYGSRNAGLSGDNRQVIINSAMNAMASIAAADIDHDGYDDIIAIHYDGSSWTYPSQIYFGTSNGIAPQTASIDIQYSYNPGIGDLKTGFLNVKAISDINGDGYADLAFSESLEGIFLQNDPNPNANVFIVPTGTELMARLRGDSVTLSEISRYQIDGEADDSLGMGLGSASWNILAVPETGGVGLVIGAPGNKKAYYFSHTALETACLTENGGCQAASAASQTFAAADHPDQEFGKALAVLDQNGDGISDILFGLPSLLPGSGNPQNYILKALGSNGADGIAFSTPAQFNSETMTKGYFGTNLLPANLLGDGLEALIVGGASTVDDRLHIFWNKAATGVNPQYGSIIEGPATFGSSLEIGDFNGDGRLDLFVGAPSCTNCGGSGDKNGEFHVYY